MNKIDFITDESIRVCNELDALRAQRDALAAALRNMMAHTYAAAYALETIDRLETANSLRGADKYARAALAKLESAK